MATHAFEHTRKTFKTASGKKEFLFVLKREKP